MISNESICAAPSAIIGDSAAVQRLRALIEKAARTDLSVLIVGETGTGKELTATKIHSISRRNGAPFVAVNTGALPRELVASELFGHCRGAFTGATEHRCGRFREADGGTLFLDEIGTMDDAAQIALLRALEDGSIRPVGESVDRQVDVRVIAATNEDPRTLAERGQFRHDLLYRFEVLRIDLPPLREIPEDIPRLAAHFVRQISEQYGMPIAGVSRAAFQAFHEYAWPGNARELKNVIAQACALADGGTVEIEHLPARIVKPKTNGHTNGFAAAAGMVNGDGLHVSGESVSSGNGIHEAGPPTADGVFMPVGASLDSMQRAYVFKTLEACGNNKTQAARMLGMSRKTLYDRLDRWGWK